ncbi:hypothetical protein LPJ61_004324 [Coemansia biformis]|uniref:Uncharacterized protein n=1 Tax=Coemansia biformis TaxID=1286918 RepID=A0A9W7YAG8_9FUNG|nr:hypothetical protein LPJ61_004324 [Coemansia biformis]
MDEQRDRVEARARSVEEAAALRAAVEEGREAQVEALAAGVAPAAAEVRAARLAVQLRQERIILEDMRAMLARQRAAAAREAGEVFPVELDVEGEWTVCGMRIERADRVQGWQIGETAAGLGAVARCVEWVGRCVVAAPLRFPLVPRGSRSAVVGPGGAEWPLFMLRAADRPRMRAAVRMVAVDIEQLLWAFGIGPVDRRDLLPNLTQLLLAIESASFAP